MLIGGVGCFILTVAYWYAMGVVFGEAGLAPLKVGDIPFMGWIAVAATGGMMLGFIMSSVVQKSKGFALKATAFFLVLAMAEWWLRRSNYSLIIAAAFWVYSLHVLTDSKPMPLPPG